MKMKKKKKKVKIFTLLMDQLQAPTMGILFEVSNGMIAGI